MNGIYPDLTVATTKWGASPTEVEAQREAEYSALYSRAPHRFLDTRESAWNIVHLRPVPPIIQLLAFGDLLDTLLTRTVPKPKRGILATFASLFGFRKPLIVKHPHDRTNTVRGLCARLALVFQDAYKCKLLLSCHGFEAQALLDTFQLILDTGHSEGDLRRNLIIAIRKLSTKTDLYPTPFYLKKLDQVNDTPEAGGAYGDIHRGVYQGRDICLKSIKVYTTTKPERIVKMIAREAVLWGQLEHTNLLPFYGLYLYNQRLSLISPWARNGTVSDFLLKQPKANRILLCSDIAEGIGYLHDNDIIHGDLKGVNILVDISHRAYLADFGLSAVEDPEILAWSRNSTASRGGTVRWQAPELFKIETTEQDSYSGIPQNTKATDIYAFSCVCYEIFTGSIPFPLASDGQVMLKVMSGERPLLPSKSILGFSDEFRTLIRACWGAEPMDRPSISDVRAQLAPLIPGDHRSPGEWQGRLSLREGGNTADIPLTPRMLDKILRRTLQ
ncbi:hypothetical protein C0991_006812 [Blastosporella zonata]|nr:hypothetical protein C0991_006812 [Blastosporella zonata]